MRDYYKFPYGYLLRYTCIVYVSSTSYPILKVIMARICLTCNMMANTRGRERHQERERVGKEVEVGKGARTPEDEHEKKGKRKSARATRYAVQR